jgi:hypothetical protein
MDWRLQAARWELCRIPGEELPSVAAEALMEGNDTPSLRLLAGEFRPTLVDAGPLFEAALSELGIVLPDAEAAVMTVALDLAARMVEGAIAAPCGVRAMAALARDMPNPPSSPLWTFVGLDSDIDDFGDSVRIDYYGEPYCAEVRRRCEREALQACAALLHLRRVG